MKIVLHKALWQMLSLVLMASVAGVVANQVRPDGISLRVGQGEMSGVGFLEGGTISLEQAHEGFRAKGILFIDARSPSLFANGHIPKAKNLPWAEVAKNPGVVSDLPRGTPIVVYDDGQEVSAMNLAIFLVSIGHKSTRVLDGGWTGWKSAGFPVETVK